MVGRLLVWFVWLNLQLSVSWLVDFQQGSCGSIFSFVSWQVDFQWGSCGSFFCFLCHGWQTFSGLRVAQSFVFYVMVGRLLVGFVWLNLQFSVSWQVDFQWVSCGSIFSFLCHGRQIFSGVRVAQSLVFCVMVGRLLVGFVWLNLQFCVMVGIFLVGFVWLNLQFYVSWLVDFQWGFVWLNLFLCHGRQTFSGVRVAQSLVFYVMVGRLLVGFVWLNLQFSVSWLVDFQWGSCGSIFSFLCHGWQTFSGVRVAQSLVFCVMIGRHLVGFVWLKLQFSVSWQVDFQWVSCRSIFSFVSWQVDFQWGSCGSIFSFLCHGWQTFSGFVWLNLQFSVSWWQTFSGVRVAQSSVFCVMLVDIQWGSCGSIFSFLCHNWQILVGFCVNLVLWS